VEQLTNWYIRFNRKRLKGDAGQEDARLALWCLGEVLYTQSLVMSPFAPFFAEYSYLKLRPYIKAAVDAEVASGAAAAGGAAVIAGWSVEVVSKWLAANPELGDYAGLFEKNKLSGADLVDLSHDDLTSMGVEVCHDRKVILREVAKLVGSTSEAGDTDGAEVKCAEVTPSVYDSIHFQMLPQPNPDYDDDDIVRAFEVMKSIVNSGRIIRDRATIPIKYPLRELVVISKNEVLLKDSWLLQSYIEEELNIQVFTVTPDEATYVAVHSPCPHLCFEEPATRCGACVRGVRLGNLDRVSHIRDYPFLSLFCFTGITFKCARRRTTRFSESVCAGTLERLLTP
jgi:isoleucyl-tRNA synthetase